MTSNNIIYASKQGSYIIIAPYANFAEAPNNIGEFSYPYSDVYYNRSELLTNENYIFSINSISDPSLITEVSVANIPNNKHTGVLEVSAAMFDKIVTNSQSVSISITGETSGNEDIVNFSIYPKSAIQFTLQ